MVRSCAAYNCSNKYGYKDNNGRDITFHRFPLSNVSLNQKWTAAFHRENFYPTVNHMLCSVNFEDNSYLSNYVNRCQLKDDAVPTIFDFPPQLSKVKKERRPPKPSNEFSIAGANVDECLNEMPCPSTSGDHNYSLVSSPICF